MILTLSALVDCPVVDPRGAPLGRVRHALIDHAHEEVCAFVLGNRGDAFARVLPFAAASEVAPGAVRVHHPADVAPAPRLPHLLAELRRHRPSPAVRTERGAHVGRVCDLGFDPAGGQVWTYDLRVPGGPAPRVLRLPAWALRWRDGDAVLRASAARLLDDAPAARPQPRRPSKSGLGRANR